MDGSLRQKIVLTKIVYPFGVTVDYPNRHVYWVDGYLSHVERVDYNGENRRIITKLKTVSIGDADDVAVVMRRFMV